MGDWSGNWTTGFIDIFAKFGQAYDRKTVQHNVVMARVKRTGDGSHYSENPKAQYKPKNSDHLRQYVILQDADVDKSREL